MQIEVQKRTFVVFATWNVRVTHHRKAATVSERKQVMRIASRPRSPTLFQPYSSTVVFYLKFSIMLTVINVHSLIFLEALCEKIRVVPLGSSALTVPELGCNTRLVTSRQYDRFGDHLHTLISLSLHSKTSRSERYSIVAGLVRNPGDNHGWPSYMNLRVFLVSHGILGHRDSYWEVVQRFPENHMLWVCSAAMADFCSCKTNMMLVE